MNNWKVIIYKINKIWNWRANDKDSDLTIPIFGKTFKSEKQTKKDWERYAKRHKIKNWKYIKENE